MFIYIYTEYLNMVSTFNKLKHDLSFNLISTFKIHLQIDT